METLLYKKTTKFRIVCCIVVTLDTPWLSFNYLNIKSKPDGRLKAWDRSSLVCIFTPVRPTGLWCSERWPVLLSFPAGTVAEGAPIIPISAQLKYNIEVVCEYIVKKIPVPIRDFTSEPRLIGKTTTSPWADAPTLFTLLPNQMAHSLPWISYHFFTPRWLVFQIRVRRYGKMYYRDNSREFYTAVLYHSQWCFKHDIWSC